MNKQTLKKIFAAFAVSCVTVAAAGALAACEDKHSHTLETHEAKAATCTDAGYDAYYVCSGCGEMFSDAEGKHKIDEIVTHSALGHDLETHGAESKTCTEAGWEEYQTCKRDGCDYSTKVEIPASHGTLVEYPATSATCTDAGHDAYYICPDCGDMFSDKAGEHKIEAIVTRPATGHGEVTTTEGRPSTCTVQGYETYYTCPNCLKDFADEACTQPLAEIPKLPLADHTPVKTEAVPVSCVDGQEEYYTCSECGGMFADEACTTPIDAPVVIPTTGNHAYVHVAAQAQSDPDVHKETMGQLANVPFPMIAHYHCPGCGKTWADENGEHEINVLLGSSAVLVGEGKNLVSSVKTNAYYFFKAQTAGTYRFMYKDLSGTENSVTGINYADSTNRSRTGTAVYASTASPAWKGSAFESKFSPNTAETTPATFDTFTVNMETGDFLIVKMKNASTYAQMNITNMQGYLNLGSNSVTVTAADELNGVEKIFSPTEDGKYTFTLPEEGNGVILNADGFEVANAASGGPTYTATLVRGEELKLYFTVDPNSSPAYPVTYNVEIAKKVTGGITVGEQVTFNIAAAPNPKAKTELYQSTLTVDTAGEYEFSFQNLGINNSQAVQSFTVTLEAEGMTKVEKFTSAYGDTTGKTFPACFITATLPADTLITLTFYGQGSMAANGVTLLVTPVPAA